MADKKYSHEHVTPDPEPSRRRHPPLTDYEVDTGSIYTCTRAGRKRSPLKAKQYEKARMLRTIKLLMAERDEAVMQNNATLEMLAGVDEKRLAAESMRGTFKRERDQLVESLDGMLATIDVEPKSNNPQVKVTAVQAAFSTLNELLDDIAKVLDCPPCADLVAEVRFQKECATHNQRALEVADTYIKSLRQALVDTDGLLGRERMQKDEAVVAAKLSADTAELATASYDRLKKRYGKAVYALRAACCHIGFTLPAAAVDYIQTVLRELELMELYRPADNAIAQSYASDESMLREHLAAGGKMDRERATP